VRVSFRLFGSMRVDNRFIRSYVNDVWLKRGSVTERRFPTWSYLKVVTPSWALVCWTMRFT
jgi:hypothetical protein